MGVCNRCGAEVGSGAVICIWCGAAFESGAANSAAHGVEAAQAAAPGSPERKTDVAAGARNLSGIRGWLILFALGLVLAPLACLRSLLIELGTLNGDAYQVFLADHPGRAAMLLFGAATMGILLIGTIALNLLFFKRRKEFPFWGMATFAGQCAFLLILQAWLVVIHSDSLRSASLSGLGAAESLIWIAYLARSRRVKQTFVH